MVDREKFDPILNASNPLTALSPQNYADKRITTSRVKFRGFQYKAEFIYEKEPNVSEFKEHMRDDETSNVRQNKHKLYMEPRSTILSMAERAGFKQTNVSDMKICQYENQYLYFLQRD